MTHKEILSIVVFLLLFPVGLYLRDLVYSSIRRPYKLLEDIENLSQSFKEWRKRRRYRRDQRKK